VLREGEEVVEQGALHNSKVGGLPGGLSEDEMEPDRNWSLMPGREKRNRPPRGAH